MQASGVDCEGPKKQEDSEQLQGVKAQMNESTGLSSNVQQIDRSIVASQPPQDDEDESDEESKVKVDEEDKVFIEEQLLLEQEKDFKN